MDRKLISVALIAAALVLVSMVSVGLSYSSIYQTENTCTITCTYGYGETQVTGVVVNTGFSDLTFTSLGNEEGTNTLDVTYNDTKAGDRVGLNIYIEGAGVFANRVCTVTLFYDLDGDGSVGGIQDESTRQVGYVTVAKDGTVSAYGFHLDLKKQDSNGITSVKTMKFTLQASFDAVADDKIPLKLTIKAIREA